jgi:saccharopine dehydrogenase (NAD+, L-lysine forming)
MQQPILIALIRERKNPPDNRVALTPVQCVALMNRFPMIQVVVESCATRCFSDEAYEEVGIEVRTDVSTADIMLGIKEVPKEFLIPQKTYLFFSHTIKKQPYNQLLLKEIIKKQIRLIDYEVLKWETGQRVLGFGRYAGIVGAYNGFLTYGQKTGLFHLNPAWLSIDYSEILSNALSIKLPPIKIALTGGGRVAQGALDFLRSMRIKEVTPQQFLSVQYSQPVFVHLNSPDLYCHPEKTNWDTHYFYGHHNEYQSSFDSYTRVADILMNGIYWTKDLPALFSKDDTARDDFQIKVIADISCDVEGSIPITYEATTIQNPVIGWDKINQTPCKPFTENSIDVMAVGNLPNELPKDASEEFGELMLQHVLPALLADKSTLIEKATICVNGNLTDNFDYLTDYIA